MDHFLEGPAYWLDFHSRFINCWCEAIADVLPASYEAGLGERILEGPRENYIEILHHPERTLVAVLELLSPGNKEYPGRTEYLAERMAILKQNVHLVELDLLVGGRRLPMQEPLPPADYFYLVSRAERRPDCNVYRWTVKQLLPKLPVPLLTPDADIVVDLAAIFDAAYQRGRFGRRIDYQAPPPSALSDDDRQWAAGIAAARH